MDFAKKVRNKPIYYFFFLLFLFFPFGQLLRFEVFEYVNINIFDIPVFLIACFGLFKWRTSLFKADTKLFSFLCICAFTLGLGSLMVSNDILLEGLLYFLRFLIYACFYFSLLNLLKDNKFSSYVKKGLFISGVAFTLIGLCQYIFFPDLRALSVFGWDDHYYRLTGLFFDPGFTGALLVLFILYLLDLIPKNKTNYLLVLLALITTLALALTFSRSSYLALIIGVLSISYLQKKIIFPLILLICFATFVNFAPKPGGEGVNLERTSTVYSRLENYVRSEQLILANPLFGIGFNLFPAFSEGGLNTRRGVDSSLLFITLTTGIIGLLIYMSWFFLILKKAYDSRSGLVFGSLIAMLTHSLFQNSLFYSWVLVWLFLLVALEIKESK